MVDLQKIKDEVAVKHGIKSWKDVGVIYRYIYTDEIATEYARQCCQLQIEACAENAERNAHSKVDGELIVDKESILNTKNIVE